MNHNIKSGTCLLMVLGLMVFSLCSCEDDVNIYSYDENLISMIVADNPNLSFLNTAIQRAELFDTLLQAGPYTLLAASDDAFKASGYTESSISSTGKTVLEKIVKYHIIEGEDVFDILPLGFNHVVKTNRGAKFFATRYVNGRDTLLTINGVSSNKLVYTANNGSIRIISRVLEPYSFEYLTEAMSDNPEITLFRHALKRTSVNQLLSAEGAYTVFALNNTTMTQLGYSSLQIINNKKVDELEAFVKRYVVDQRNFVNDYILMKPKDSEQLSIQLLNGEKQIINLLSNPQIPGSYSGISLDRGAARALELQRRDLLAGNGVLHIIYDPRYK